MGIWDKAKTLGGTRMDQHFQDGEAFILYGMKIVGEVDLENGMAPATKTILHAERVAPNGKGGFQTFKDREAETVVVGALASPIADMAQGAGPDDFPVIVCWKSVQTKSREKATVLDYLGKWEGDGPVTTPSDWNVAD